MVRLVVPYTKLTFPTLLIPLMYHEALQQVSFSKGLTVFVPCLLFQTPFSWPVSTAISMINNIYYKCTLYYAFYEASTNPWSLKHAFQLKFHLSPNNMRIIMLQHQQKKKGFYFSITLYFLQMESQGIFLFGCNCFRYNFPLISLLRDYIWIVCARTAPLASGMQPLLGWKPEAFNSHTIPYWNYPLETIGQNHVAVHYLPFSM